MQRVFMWDWKEAPPQKEIDFAIEQEGEGAELWLIDSGCDTYVGIIAKTEKEVTDFQKQWDKTMGE